MRVLICGSRDWKDEEAIRLLIASFPSGTVIIHGAARGADSIAGRFAKEIGLEIESYPAKWKEHHLDWCPGSWCATRSYCVGAGPRRNKQMLDEGSPDVVHAFSKDLTSSRGTRNMVEQARKAFIQVETHSE